MAHDGQDLTMDAQIIVEDLLKLTAEALPPVDGILDQAKASVRALVSVDGRVSNALVEANQTAAHGLAWLATYAQSLNQMHLWGEKPNS